MFTVTNYAVGSGNSFMQLDSSFIIVLQLCVNKSFLIHTKKKKKKRRRRRRRRKSFLSVLLDISKIKCEFAILVAFHAKHICYYVVTKINPVFITSFLLTRFF